MQISKINISVFACLGPSTAAGVLQKAYKTSKIQKFFEIGFKFTSHRFLGIKWVIHCRNLRLTHPSSRLTLTIHRHA